MSNYNTEKFNCECFVCKKPIYKMPYQLKNLKDGKPTCSRQCSGKKNRKEFNCSCCICNKPLKRSPSQLSKLEDGLPVCSRKCMGLKDTRKNKQPNCKCTMCGKSFHRAKNQIEKTGTENIVCSTECSNKAKSRKSYDRMCEAVGGDFKEWIVYNYWEKELPSRELAYAAYGKPKNSPNIIGWMKKLDVPTRERTDAVALQWKGNFGRRINQSIATTNLWGVGTKGRENLIAIMQTDAYKLKQSVAKKGNKNGMFGITGEEHPNWNPELTREDRIKKRNYREYSEWRTKVFERDNYTCKKCNDEKGGTLNAHHINGHHWDKESRLEIDNGVTLCELCHKEFHSIYGYKDNNLFQFSQYMNEVTIN